MNTENLKTPFDMFTQAPLSNNADKSASPAVQTVKQDLTSAPDTYTPSPIASTTIGEEKKSSHTLTAAVSALALTGGALALLFLKGPSSAFYKKINSCLQKLDDKIYDYTAKYNTLGTIQKWYLCMNQGLRKMLSSLKMCDNITVAKDSGFRWVCDKLYLTKPMNWVTNQFKKITISSSAKAYEKARNVADTNIAKLREYIPALRSKNQEAADKLVKLIDKLEKELGELTSATNRNARLKEIEAATKDVGKKVDADLSQIIRDPSKENLSKLKIYRTEVNSSAGKEVLNDTLQKAKTKCTFNIDDIHKVMKDAKDEISLVLAPEDRATRGFMRTLSKQIEQFKGLSGKTESQDRDALIRGIKSTIEQAKQAFSSQKYSAESAEIFNNQLDKINSILGKTQEKGTIEDILTILNKNFKSHKTKEYFAAKNLTNEIRSVINEACDKELKLYDKFAEYSVGSAPTDVLGLAIPVGLAGYAISKGDDKNEKISATLKAGIPISGAVAATFLATAKMLTNMQGLIMGLVSGMVLNALGSKADEHYKAYTEDRLFAQKAIAAYKDTLSKSDNA